MRTAALGCSFLEKGDGLPLSRSFVLATELPGRISTKDKELQHAHLGKAISRPIVLRISYPGDSTTIWNISFINNSSCRTIPSLKQIQQLWVPYRY